MAHTFPSFSQWKQIFKVLKKREKIALLVFFLSAFSSLGFLATDFYIKNTKVAPAFGGTYIEGIVGQPRFINPIYGETNDVDRTLINLVFSSLMDYDNSGKLIPSLAEDYKVSEDGKIYEFELKENIFWHDGKPLTSDDVLFTIRTIQNPDYKSPLRANWIEVEAEKVSDKSLKLILKAPYNSFLENCTLKILPKHIWETISPENFTLSSYNLKPIGSGPFKFAGIDQNALGFIKALHFNSSRRYFGRPSYIANISFQFFEKKEGLIDSVNAGEINGFTLASLDNNETEAEKEIRQGWPQQEKFSVYSFSLPRYFAVFFNNQKLKIFSDENIRKALLYGINKEELVEKIKKETKNNIALVNSPILPEFFGYQDTPEIYSFDTDKAKSLLDKAGFKDTGSGVREKAIQKKPAFQFKSYLKVGSKGTEVTQLQGCLAKLSDGNFSDILKEETNGTYGKATEDAVTEFQKKYLPGEKPTGEVGKATRAQLNALCVAQQPNSQPLRFILVTVNQPQLIEVANMLKNYWQDIGVSVQVTAVSVTDLKPIIKNRDYDALLYGEALGSQPDLYPLWHSSQKIDPGLNLSSYENKNADQLLKEARETLDEEVKKQKYEKLQDIIIKDAPALFLYNPDYIYWVSEGIKGIATEKIIDPAKRFVNITNWHIKTKRVWK